MLAKQPRMKKSQSKINFLPREDCKALMQRLNLPNTEAIGSNMFMYPVIDCALVDGKLVVYELQNSVESLMSPRVFVKGLDFFDQQLFIYTLRPNKMFISDQKFFVDIEHLMGLSVKKMQNPKWMEEQLNLDAKKTLIVMDYPEWADQSTTLRAMYHAHSEHENIFWMDAESNLHPSQSVFYSKHMQRFLMSEFDLAPPFVFLENKSAYSQIDLMDIIESLALEESEQIVIKANHETQGEGNVFLEVPAVLSYLNSSQFKQKFKNDSVILIEKVKNQKINGLFQTHRYAVCWLPDEPIICTDVYQEDHNELDSHIHPTLTWLERPIKDEKCKEQIAQLLQTIYYMDYNELMFRLLTSESKIKKLLALDFLKLRALTFFTRAIKGASKALCLLDIPSTLSHALQLIALDPNIKLRNTLLELHKQINYLKWDDGSSKGTLLFLERLPKMYTYVEDLKSLDPERQLKAMDDLIQISSNFFVENKQKYHLNIPDHLLDLLDNIAQGESQALCFKIYEFIFSILDNERPLSDERSEKIHYRIKELKNTVQKFNQRNKALEKIAINNEAEILEGIEMLTHYHQSYFMKVHKAGRHGYLSLTISQSMFNALNECAKSPHDSVRDATKQLLIKISDYYAAFIASNTFQDITEKNSLLQFKTLMSSVPCEQKEEQMLENIYSFFSAFFSNSQDEEKDEKDYNTSFNLTS